MLDNLYIALPESSKKWYYNTKEMEPLRPQIDAITKYYLEKYHKEDMEYIQSYFEKRSESYTEAYGNRKNSPNQYAENKMDDLYTRMGNEILKDFRNFEQEKKEEYFRHLKSSTADKNTKQRHSKKRSFSAYRKNSGTGNGKLAAALQKTMNDAMKQHMKNLQAYELQQQASEELEL
jgi:hypothetical protein